MANRETAHIQDAWDALTRSRVMSMSRDAAIAWLMWNDPNGDYDDEVLRAQGLRPLTTAQARSMLWKMVLESRE